MYYTDVSHNMRIQQRGNVLTLILIYLGDFVTWRSEKILIALYHVGTDRNEAMTPFKIRTQPLDMHNVEQRMGQKNLYITVCSA